MNQDPIVIVAAKRTPQGGMQGSLQAATAPQLGTAAIKALFENIALDKSAIDGVIMGCVLPAGLGQAPARQAALGAGLSIGTPATTINKMCGSGMQAMIMAHDALLAGSQDMIVAGGMESMTNAPYLLPKMRGGARLGHTDVKDHMFLDGLEDAYNPGQLMGVFAEVTAEKYDFTREAQDEFAIESLKRAQTAQNNHDFDAEITPVTVKVRRSEVIVTEDEQPKNAKIDKIPTLRPAFKKDGTVTAANASSISDGASACLMMRESEANKQNLKPLARIHAHATHARAPEEFTIAPIGAIEKVLTKTGWSKDDVDLFEINEAFAVVTMAAIKDLSLDSEKVNVLGGACALGHPIGASGCRIVVTLLHALKNRGLKKGIASLCIGGGEATAMAVEII